MRLTTRKPHIRLHHKRPNGGAWYAYVSWGKKREWSSISVAVGFYSTLPELYAVVERLP